MTPYGNMLPAEQARLLQRPPQRQGGYAPMPMPQYYQPNQQQQPYQPNMHQFLSAYGKQGGGMFQVGLGAQQQRDINGRPPGMWGYQQPQQSYRPPAIGFRYAPPQYQGNPFMPAVPY